MLITNNVFKKIKMALWRNSTFPFPFTTASIYTYKTSLLLSTKNFYSSYSWFSDVCSQRFKCRCISKQPLSNKGHKEMFKCVSWYDHDLWCSKYCSTEAYQWLFFSFFFFSSKQKNHWDRWILIKKEREVN